MLRGNWIEKQTPGWTPCYASDVTQRLEKNIFPYLGSHPINEITPPDLLAVMHKMELRGTIDTTTKSIPVFQVQLT